MHAVVRELPDSYKAFYAKRNIFIDMDLARQQHEKYARGLEWMGLRVDILPADEKLPDCCFIEDCAVINKNKALIPILGSKYRRKETAAAAEFFRKTHKLYKMRLPAKLEGGDVLATKEQVYVGLSKVTNKYALPYLNNIFERQCKAVPVKKTLHLKSACSAIKQNQILLAENMPEKSFFEGTKIIRVPEDERHAANAVSIGNKVLVPSPCPRTIKILKKQGFKTKSIDISEFMKGEGSLTCLSIIY